MWVWRRMEGICLMDRVNNEAVLARIGEKTKTLKIIKEGENFWNIGCGGTTLWLRHWKLMWG